MSKFSTKKVFNNFDVIPFPLSRIWHGQKIIFFESQFFVRTQNALVELRLSDQRDLKGVILEHINQLTSSYLVCKPKTFVNPILENFLAKGIQS